MPSTTKSGLPPVGVEALVAELERYLRDVNRMNAANRSMDKSLEQTSQASKKFGETVASSTRSASIQFAALVGVIYSVKKAYAATLGDAIAYNKSILDSSRAAGIGSEEYSRIVQVADDFGISMNSVETALAMATKRGFAPSVESLAQLADRVNQIQDPTQRAAELAKVFGKNWAGLDPLLQAGGDSIRELAAAVSDGLVATEAEIAATEEMRLNIDEFNDSIKSATLSIGNFLAKGLNPWIQGLKDTQGAYAALNDDLIVGADNYDEYAASLNDLTFLQRAFVPVVQEDEFWVRKAALASGEAAVVEQQHANSLLGTAAAAWKAVEANRSYFDELTKGTGGALQAAIGAAAYEGAGGQAVMDAATKARQAYDAGFMSVQDYGALAEALLPAEIITEYYRKNGERSGWAWDQGLKKELLAAGVPMGTEYGEGGRFEAGGMMQMIKAGDVQKLVDDIVMRAQAQAQAVQAATQADLGIGGMGASFADQFMLEASQSSSIPQFATAIQASFEGLDFDDLQAELETAIKLPVDKALLGMHNLDGMEVHSKHYIHTYTIKEGIAMQHGGSFIVGGQPGPDANLVPLRLTRGEMVTVTPANQVANTYNQQNMSRVGVAGDVHIGGRDDAQWFDRHMREWLGG